MATNKPRLGHERKRSQLKTKATGQKHWTKRLSLLPLAWRSPVRSGIVYLTSMPNFEEMNARARQLIFGGTYYSDLRSFVHGCWDRVHAKSIGIRKSRYRVLQNGSASYGRGS